MVGSYSKGYRSGEDLLKLVLDIQEVDSDVNRVAFTMALGDGEIEIAETLYHCQMSERCAGLVADLFNSPGQAEMISFYYNGKYFSILQMGRRVETFVDPDAFFNVVRMFDLVKKECGRAERKYASKITGARRFRDRFRRFGMPGLED